MKWVSGLALTISAALFALSATACQGVATAQPVAAAPHPKAEAKAAKPKGLEAIIEVHMFDNYFANAAGEQNPTFRVSAGKTVGFHIHNEGKIVHELAIGRKLKVEEKEVSGKKVTVPAGYETNLFDMVDADLFFYYGTAKAELEGAKFEELEIEPGIRDTWIRLKFPESAKGTWELGCFVPGHYETGMKTTLIVE